MVGYLIGMHDVKTALRRLLDKQARAWAGIAFMVLALAAIQYDEIIAPEVHRISDGFTGIAMDMRSRITSLTL